jgi:leucyl aminopeptidase (aminopeptidase T)
MDWELAAAAYKLVKEVMLVQPGETVVITGDTNSTEEVLEATARAARAVGAVPIVIRVPMPARAHLEPPRPLAEAIKASDVWIEYAFRPIFFTDAYLAAVEAGTRYLNLARARVDWFIRTIGDVDYAKMVELGDRLVDLTNKANVVRVTNPAGTDISGRNGGRKAHNQGPATEKGKTYMLGGQVGWCPIEETVNGTIVFDGMISYPEELNQLAHPIRIEVEDGVISDISGGPQADILDRWLRGFKDRNMLRFAHFTYGFNPGAKVSEHVVEAERAYGVHVFGFGRQVPSIGGKGWDAPGHTDGIVLNPSVWLDDELVEKDGQFVHPKLASLDQALRSG